MSDLPRDPADVGEGGEDLELDPNEDLETEGEDIEGEEGEDPPEPVEGEDGEDPAPQPRRKGGPKGRPFGEQIRTLNSRLEASERELAELRRRPAPAPVDPAAQARAAAERAERRQLMSPSELAADITQELSGQFGQALQSIQFTNADALDQQRFESSSVRSPIRARYAERVEQALQAERAQGRNHSREALFKYLYGEDMEKRATRAAPAQRRAGAARVAGQTVRPAGARSDSVPGRRPAAGTVAHDEAVLDEARRSGRSPWE